MPENNQNSTPTSQKKTANVQKESASAVSEILPPETAEESDELFDEQEEDFFWIIQRIVWGFVKIAFGIGIMVFIIWIIWKPETEELVEIPNKILASKDESPIIDEVTSETTKEIPTAEAQIPEILHIPVEDYDNLYQKNILVASTQWLKNAQTYFQKPAIDLIPSSIPNIRTSRINDILRDINDLIHQSKQLQSRLYTDYTEYINRSQEANKESVLNEEAFYTALRNLNGHEAEIFLNQKADAETRVMTNSVYASGRKIIMQNIQYYDKRLKRLYENIIANREALIHDIKVVNFPESTLEIILSPQEWRSIQNGQ